MKGFGARERNGLIVFCCFVIFFLAIGPLAGRMGCTSRHSVPESFNEMRVNVSEADSVEGASLIPSKTEAAQIGNSGNESDTTICKKKRRKCSKRFVTPVDPARRNYLDEPL